MVLAPTLSLSAGSGAAIVRPTFSRDFAGEKTLDNGTGPAITFTRASNATFFDANGTLQTAANDTPRFDHSGGSSLGLLIEEQRTNLLLNSATLATQTVTVTAVAQTLSFYGTGEIVLSGAHSATVTGTGAFPTRTTLTFTPAAGSLTATVSGTVENAQLELGAFATSYIPTTNAAATRAADSAVVTPISSFYNQVEGTVLTEALRTISVASGVFPTAIRFQASNPLFRSGITVTNNRAYWAGTNNTTPEWEIGSTLSKYNITVGTPFRFAGCYATNNIAASMNGQTVDTDTVANVIEGVATLRIGQANNASYFNGYIRKIAYWPKRLTNTLLEQLTT
jgi:hypothetical protein